MKIHSHGGKCLNLGGGSTGFGDDLASAYTHAYLVFNAHAKFAEGDGLKIMFQGLQYKGQASLLDTMGEGVRSPEYKTNYENAQAGVDSLADMGAALTLFWAPNSPVVLDSLSLNGLSQVTEGESTSLLGGMVKQNVREEWSGLDPLAKGKRKSISEQDALVSLQTLSLLKSVVVIRDVTAKMLDVSKPKSMRKVSRLQELEERGGSSLLDFPSIINQSRELAEVSMSSGKGGGDFAAALSSVSKPIMHLAGTNEIKDIASSLNVTMSAACTQPSAVALGTEPKAVATAEHFAPSPIWSISAPTAFVEGHRSKGGAPDVGQGLSAAKPDVPCQVSGVVPSSSHLKLVMGAKSERPMQVFTSEKEQTVVPFMLARDPNVSAVQPVFVGNESASKSQAGHAERSVCVQEVVTSAPYSLWSISALEGESSLSLTTDVGQGSNKAKFNVPSQTSTTVFGGLPDSSRLKLAEGGRQSELAMLAPVSMEEQAGGALVLARGSKVAAVSPVFACNESARELPARTTPADQVELSIHVQEVVTSALLQMLPEPNLNALHYKLASHPVARSIPAPVLQVPPGPLEQQGFTYNFKSWGNGAFVSINTLSTGDVRFVPSDVQVLQALQTYEEDHAMPQHWRVEASERRDDEVPRRQARALLVEEENDE